ncbi:BCCT family transporter [Corynebacterium suicordis]|uniref:BCCT family transporter n=1 Tax=Corynebacterium suicordis DSM 45110 TaxID=1121369 RepID=A0ABR9ZJ51_9CORY|nr:BCCT family transporter [Corynebacterium suicordis]MBF4553106.1 BCCT family transporter [Corynebacterium suicordis DSM 45110]MDR6277931.1 choline/carnitine/betaine transport [Corynebacterium suicordis]
MTDLQVNTDQYESEAERDDAPMNWPVTISAGALVLIVVLWGLLAKDSFASVSNAALSFVRDDFGWLFMIAGTVFVGFILFVAFSKYGHIRLGKADERPEFSTISWISMMFAAGMGIGLMFYGTTEPLTFFRDGVPGREAEDAGAAFASTIFHWGLHPWALYAIVALAIAYSSYRLGNKQLLSAAFIPLIGRKRAEGILGTIIDVLAIFATVFGTAASLGIGALQIRSGLEVNDFISSGSGMGIVIAIIVVLGVCFILSAFSGVGKGIQYLSNANMVLALILAIFVFIVGPTVVILNYIPASLGSYLDEFFEMASRTSNSGEETATWLNSWTIFYWAWWTSWSPFVGMFVARISRGRTIREFVIVVLLVPTLVSVVWFSIFGGSAIHLEKIGQSIWGDGDSTAQLFTLLHQFPAGTVMSVVAMALLATFFITSADSASTVMGSMSQNGRLTASRMVTVLWGLLTALIAIVMLTTGGEDSLSNLQNLTIIAASPFVLIIIGLCFSIVKALGNDPALIDEKLARQASLKEAHERRVGGHGDSRGGARRKQFRAGTLNSSMTTASGAPAVPIHDIDAEDSVIGVIEVSDIQDIMDQTHDDATGVTRENARGNDRNSARGTAKPAAEDS